jgi:hypothetical protein
MHYYTQEYSKKNEKLEKDRQETQELIVEGITALFKAMRG